MGKQKEKPKQKDKYCCPSCGGEVSKKEYQAGKKECEEKDCERFGKPLEEMQYCAACEEYYTSDTAEEHSNC